MAFNISKIEISAPPKTVQTSYIEVLILLVVTGLFYWFLVSPKVQVLKANMQARDELKIQQENSAKELATLQALVTQLASSGIEIQKLDEALPLEGKNFRLKMLIEYLAGTFGLTIGSVTVEGKGDAVLAGDKALLEQPFKATRKLQKMSVGMFVTGTFDQLQGFIKKLENNSRLMDIQSISMGPAQEGLLGLSLSIDAYYFAP